MALAYSCLTQALFQGVAHASLETEKEGGLKLNSRKGRRGCCAWFGRPLGLAVLKFCGRCGFEANGRPPPRDHVRTVYASGDMEGVSDVGPTLNGWKEVREIDVDRLVAEMCTHGRKEKAARVSFRQPWKKVREGCQPHVYFAE